MNVIMIGTDRKIFENGSTVRLRMADYGKICDELHIIVFSRGSQKYVSQQIAQNVWIYPTESLSPLTYISRAVRLVKKIMSDRQFDPWSTVISCQDPFETGLAGLRLKKQLGLKLHIQIHTDFLSPHFRSNFLNWIRVRIAKKILPQADAIRVVSKRIRHSLSIFSLLAEKIDVLPIYTDPHVFSQEPAKSLTDTYPQFNFIILIASRLTKEKDLKTALEAFQSVVGQYPKTGLVIVGDGPQKLALQRWVSKRGLEKSVVFEPWQKDLSAYFKTCSAFLLTSRYEGYGLTLAEAGLAGAAIVTTDVGIVGEILQNKKNALVCPVGDSHCLTKHLSELIRNNGLRLQLKTAVVEDMRQAIIPDHEMYLKLYKQSLQKALV